MSREIKFRAWDKEREKWIHPEEFKINGLGQKVWSLLDTESVEIMQFTGLLDRNGKEIYEGDILGWTKEGEGVGASEYYVKMEVRFKNGAFYTHKEFSVNENYLPIVATWGEVIGNIHENPELLK